MKTTVCSNSHISKDQPSITTSLTYGSANLALLFTAEGYSRTLTSEMVEALVTVADWPVDPPSPPLRYPILPKRSVD